MQGIAKTARRVRVPRRNTGERLAQMRDSSLFQATAAPAAQTALKELIERLTSPRDF